MPPTSTLDKPSDRLIERFKERALSNRSRQSSTPVIHAHVHMPDTAGPRSSVGPRTPPSVAAITEHLMSSPWKEQPQDEALSEYGKWHKEKFTGESWRQQFDEAFRKLDYEC